MTFSTESNGVPPLLTDEHRQQVEDCMAVIEYASSEGEPVGESRAIRPPKLHRISRFKNDTRSRVDKALQLLQDIDIAKVEKSEVESGRQTNRVIIDSSVIVNEQCSRSQAFPGLIKSLINLFDQEDETSREADINATSKLSLDRRVAALEKLFHEFLVERGQKPETDLEELASSKGAQPVVVYPKAIKAEYDFRINLNSQLLQLRASDPPITEESSIRQLVDMGAPVYDATQPNPGNRCPHCGVKNEAPNPAPKDGTVRALRPKVDFVCASPPGAEGMVLTFKRETVIDYPPHVEYFSSLQEIFPVEPIRLDEFIRCSHCHRDFFQNIIPAEKSLEYSEVG